MRRPTPPARRRRPLLALALLPFLSACADYRLNPPAPEFIRADASVVTDPQEIVALIPDPAAAARLKAGAGAEGFVLREETPLPGLGLQMLRFDMPGGMTGPAGIAALERIEPSSTAGVNHAYGPAAAPPGAGALDYAGRMMGWPATPCRAAGPVGMIDTGVDAAIPELAGVEVISAAFHRGDAAAVQHGTEVAAALADPRRLTGVTLYSASVIGTSARGRAETGVDGILKGLSWLTGQGVRLINISLSGPYNKLLDRGVDTAAGRGAAIVAAVGNDGAGANPRYPAALGNVVAATAVDAAGAIYRDAVRGAFVDVAAPGVDVALRVGGETRFATGTSIAAPLVTARIAADPALYGADADAIRRGLERSAADLGAPGRDPVFGAGLARAGGVCGG